MGITWREFQRTVPSQEVAVQKVFERIQAREVARLRAEATPPRA